MVHNNPDIDLVSENEYKNLVKFCLSILKILSKNQILMSIKGRNCCKFEEKMTLYNPNVDLVNDNVYTMVKFCSFILKIWSKNQSLTSVKGCNSVANFGLILSIRSQDIE